MFRSFVPLLICFLIPILLVQAEGEKAWNGHTTPGSDKPGPFTPYWVPEGAKSYDSESPLVHYFGKWVESFSSTYIHGSVRMTPFPDAYLKFSFTGTGIEWFGTIDDSHGVSKVYIDGKHVQDVDAWSSKLHKQQRLFWKYDLSNAKHTIKIVNTGHRDGDSKDAPTRFLSLDAFVVMRAPEARQDPAAGQVLLAQNPTQNSSAPSTAFARPRIMLAEGSEDQWTLTQQGSTGVHAMQLTILSSTHALVVDKVEHNPLTIDGHPAWAALYNLKTHSLIPLNVQSNSFCAGGTFLGNGTLINVGGNPVIEGFTSAADFGNLNGMQAIRVLEPCDEDPTRCRLYENHDRIRMASPRWYNTVLRISDGSAMIIGGSKKGGWINNATVNNPTLEYFPPKSIHGSNGLPIKLPFLIDTLNANLFPIAFSLPDGKIFMAANQAAMIYDWENNHERRLPGIPNSVRVTYPMAGTATLLPLSPSNGYTPEVLICGGSTIDDWMADTEISSQTPASAQCVRMVLNEEGMAAGWEVEEMPEARHMPDAVLLPTGEVLIVNGAGTGISGYGNVKDQIGASNADHPVLTPIIYVPSAPHGSRFKSAGSIKSNIPRMYHSVATLTPEGTVMIAGSNPNLDRSEVMYGTEYRVEWASPPYMGAQRPVIASSLPRVVGFGEQVRMKVEGLQGSNTQVALMDLGYVTHATHANSRLVYLEHKVEGDEVIFVAPPDGGVYPPGPGFVYLVVDGIPSVGARTLVGDGKSPPVDEAATFSLLNNSESDQSV